MSVMILITFYLFALATGFTTPMIDFTKFAVILLFGLLISCVNLVLSYEKLRLPIRIAAHYAILLVAFSVIFIVGGNLGGGNMGAIAAAVIVFTFLYAVIFPISYVLVKGVREADKRVGDRLSKSGTKKENKKPEYKSLYK